MELQELTIEYKILIRRMNPDLLTAERLLDIHNTLVKELLSKEQQIHQLKQQMNNVDG